MNENVAKIKGLSLYESNFNRNTSWRNKNKIFVTMVRKKERDIVKAFFQFLSRNANTLFVIIRFVQKHPLYPKSD